MGGGSHLLDRLLHVQVESPFDVAIGLHVVFTEAILALALAVDGAQDLLGRGYYGPRQQEHRRVYRDQVEHQRP